MKKDNNRAPSQYIFESLAKRFPNARCELNFNTPFELLIATILSAQCTDQRVNMVTKSLFATANTPEAILALGLIALETMIHSLGLYHNKAKNILATCSALLEIFKGQVPDTIDLLMKLPGVGRKTASVVVSNAYGIPAIAVDTHVYRVAHRLGLAQGKTPEKVEEELMAIYPREQWSRLHHLLIFHGRQICSARKPGCDDCPVNSVCETYSELAYSSVH